MQVNQSKTHQCEVEKPSQQSARPTCTRPSKEESEKMKMRLGNKKYHTINYQQRHHLKFKTSYHHRKPERENKAIDELCDRLKNAKASNINIIKKELNKALTITHKKLEREKDHFKDQRWKRAQGGMESPLEREEEITIDAIIKGRTYKIKVMVPLRLKSSVIETTIMLNGFKNLDYGNYQKLLAAKIREFKCLIHKPQVLDEPTFMDKVESKMQNMIKKIQCPYCSESHKCNVCILDEPDDIISTHQMRVIEDIVIAFVQLILQRNVSTFVFEFIRIIKTMFGVSIVKFDYMQMIPVILRPILGFCDMKEEVFNLTSTYSVDSLIKFIKRLFDPVVTVSTAQGLEEQDIRDEHSLEGKSLKETGLLDTLLSDWFETDLFRFGSNWFSYMCYLCISKGACTDLPFLGDLMKATIEDGKKTSKDILKYSIKTLEFVCGKGKLAMEVGFIPTFYHSKNTISTVRRRYDRLCEDYLKKGNPKVYNLDFNKFVGELASMRKELTDLSRVGTLKLKEEISKMLTRVIIMHNDVSSDSVIYADRKAPFCLLIWGNTSIGKTVFVNLTTKVNCSVHGFEYDPRFIYTKNDDERDDGYKSDMHTTILDDVGNRHPRVAPMGDPLVNKIISLNNNIATITLQADCDSKGKIPFQSSFIYATANTEHINTMYYLTYPAAALRRFNYFIELKLKPEFAENGMFCRTKEDVDYSTFNYWDIHIGKYMVGEDKEQKTGHVKYILKITNILDYYQWLAKVSTEHFKQQDLRSQSLQAFSEMQFCKKGHLGNCSCEDWSKVPLSESEPAFGEKENYTNGIHYLNKHTHEVNTRDVISPQGAFEYLLIPFAIAPVATSRFVFNEISKTKDRVVRCAVIGSGVLAHTCGFLNRTSLRLARATTRAEVKFESIHLAGQIAKGISDAKQKNDGECDSLDQAWIALSEVLFPQNDKIISSILKLAGILTTLFVGYKIYTKFTEPKTNNTYSFETVKCDHCVSRNAPQGALVSKKTSEFWVDQSNVLKDADVGASSLFYKNKQKEFLDIIAANTVLIKCCLKNKNMVDIRALCLGGWCYVTNYHVIKGREIEFIELIQDCTTQANSNLVIKYNFSNIVIDNKKDLCYFYIKDNKPKKNITNLLYRGNLNDTILDGCYLARNLNGSITQKDIKRIHCAVDTIGFKDGIIQNIDTFQGFIQTPSKEGDCGMPLIVFSHFGPVLVGLHITGKADSVSATRFGAFDLKSVNLDFRPDLAPLKLVFSDARKTLVPERLISHPMFLPTTSTLIRYGSIAEGGSRCKSSVVRTLMAPLFEDLGYQQLKSAPPMNNWRIFRKNLSELTDKASLVDQDVLDQCISTYCDHVKETVPYSEFEQMGVITDETNINGMPGVDYIDKMNRNTSMGFPWCRPKKKYLFPCSTNEHPDGMVFDDEIMDEFHRQDYVSRTACMTHAVYNASQKDEPLPPAKCMDWGTRLFFGAAVPTSLRDRKYCLSMVRFFQRNRIATRTAIGTVVQSKQWGELADLFKYKDRIMAGDYKKFDKRQQIRILHGAFDILENFAKYSKQYDEIDLNAILAIRCDTVYALVHFDGDLLAFFGALPSGNPMTTLLNCLCNILLDMYAYKTAGNDLKNYFAEVVTIVYGDDSITCIHPGCKNFNHTIKQKELAKIGITFTMAEKDKDTVPFISLSEATFLKRKFVWHDDIKAWMAPLDEKNIVSSLMVWVESKNLTPEEQAYASMQNSVREFFFHGKEKYNSMKDIYTIVYHDVYKREILFPYYEDILESFHSYGEVSVAQGSEEYNEMDFWVVIVFYVVVCLTFVLVIALFIEYIVSLRRVSHAQTGEEEVIRCCTKRIKHPNWRFCVACGLNYHVDFTCGLSDLCLQCLCIYICFDCDQNQLCIFHEKFKRRNFISVNPDSLRLLFDTLDQDNSYYDNGKNKFFQNYHWIMAQKN
jgi:hypothetical protein